VEKPWWKAEEYRSIRDQNREVNRLYCDPIKMDGVNHQTTPDPHRKLLQFFP